MDIGFGDSRIIDIGSTPRLVSFGFYSPREISKIASVEIFCPVFFDNKGNSIEGGLCDQRMGPEIKKKICITCTNSYSFCPGHFGFIEFAIPLINPFLKNLFFMILRAKCWYCGFFKLSNWKLKIFSMTLFILDNEKKLCRFNKKNSKNRISSFFEEKCLKIFPSSMTNLGIFENFVKKSSQQNQLKKGEILLQLRRKKRGENWCNTLSSFLEKCREETKCRRCDGKKLELKNSEELQNFSEKKEINLKKRNFFFEEILSLKQRKYFSFLEKNVCILIQKNEGISLKSFQLKEEVNSLWKSENVFCELVWGYPTNFKTSKANNGSYVFFLNNILVPPTRFRPIDLSQLKNSKVQVFSNPQNFYFVRMLKLNQQLLLAIGTEKKIFSDNWGIKSYFELEKELSNFCDNISFSSQKDKEKPIGIRQQLEKKMGLFRMHLMGKRVFHSARSIITPDPFLEGNEVGVPVSFSSKLTIPESLNFFSLKKNIFEKKKTQKNRTFYSKTFHSFQTIFGKKILSVNPGSELGKAQLVDICSKYFHRNRDTPSSFFGLNKIFRHLNDKDIVLLNRQPSLHKVSIMAHKVRVLPGSKCIRLHYANCNSYNADFDGDEMNLHFPQNCIAKAEGIFLSLASNQGKVPTDNLPIRGLIQDHIISSVFLTNKDTFLNQRIFSQLLSCFKNSTPNSFQFPYPSILKPKILWTGKQLISQFWELISVKSKNFFLESRTKVTSLSLGSDETKVLIRKGQLLRGILDGSQLGKNKHGVLNALFEVFGSLLANNFLHGFSCLLTFFQRIYGHTTRLDDLLLLKKIDKHRIRVFNQEKKISRFYLRKILSKKGISFLSDSTNIKEFFLFTRIIAFLCSRRVLLSQLIISIKNILSRIFSKNVESCIPGSLENNFLSNGFSKMTISGAKGSLVNTLQVSLSLGQTELEGRCIPRGISGKTLPCFPPFDTSSRSNGYITQRFLTGISQSDFFFHCMAGREGLLDTAVKTAQSGYIQRSIIKHLESHSVHYDFSTRFGKGNLSQLVYSNNGLIFPLKEISSLAKWFLQNSNLFHSSSILKDIKKYKENQIFWYFTHRFPGAKELQKMLREFFLSKKNFFHKESTKGEEKLFFWVFSKIFFEPGEPIGLITGQSLGEPCTQMTLNTFHFAGKLVSSGNVGISRLKEVLLTASKRLKNPTMSAKLKKSLPNESLSFVEKRFKTIFLSDLIELISFHIEKYHGVDFVLFRIKFCSKNLFKHQLALTKKIILKKFLYFWEKLKCSSRLFKNTCFFFKKKSSEKTKKSRLLLDITKNNEKKPFHFSKFNRLVFKHKVFKKLKGNKKKNFKFLVDGILGSEFCIRDIPRISNCFLDLEEKSIHIQGINFFALWHFQDIIEINKIFCNDIFGAMVTYGIEGARNFIFKELETIFRFQAISVAKRHLDLASDYMTRLGNYRAFNRQGLREENGFQKITYETAIRFIIENAIYKNSDDLSSVSSCVGLGKICIMGTGSFDLLFS